MLTVSPPTRYNFARIILVLIKNIQFINSTFKKPCSRNRNIDICFVTPFAEKGLYQLLNPEDVNNNGNIRDREEALG